MEKKVDHILTLTVTWDGVAITEDGKKSMWPLCCYLNELPFQDRINNAMLIALHSGKSKPKSDIMLKPMVDELLQFDLGQDLLDKSERSLITRKPLSITIDGVDKLFLVKLLLFIADAPARALVLNMNGHNSYQSMIEKSYSVIYLI